MTSWANEAEAKVVITRVTTFSLFASFEILAMWKLAFTIAFVSNIVFTALIAILNKAILVGGVHAVYLLTLHQIAGYLLSLSISKDNTQYCQRDKQDMIPSLRILMLSILTVGNLLLSQLSLKENSLFLFQIGRYLAIPMTALGDIFFNGLRLTKQRALGVTCILCGVICSLSQTYGQTARQSGADPGATHKGLVLCFASAMSQASNAVAVNSTLQTPDVSPLAFLNRLAFYNSLLYLGGCLFATALGLQFRVQNALIPTMLASCVSAVVIQYTSLRITKGSSATFYTMAGVFKRH